MGKSNYPDKITLKGKGEATRCAGSVIDPVGFVVECDGEVYRVIQKAWSAPVKNLLQHDRIEELFDAGLIRTELTDLTARGYGLVVKHEKFPFKSLYHEWAPNMLVDAAQTIVTWAVSYMK